LKCNKMERKCRFKPIFSESVPLDSTQCHIGCKIGIQINKKYVRFIEHLQLYKIKNDRRGGAYAEVFGFVRRCRWTV
jgi:hypothetical protein